MARHAQVRKRRAEMWRENPYCHWCGRLTRLLRKNKGKNRGGRTEPDQATIDHLYDRLDNRRYEPNTSSEQRYVISCYECNHSRGVDTQRRAQLLGNPSAFGTESVQRKSASQWQNRLLFRIEEVCSLIKL